MDRRVPVVDEDLEVLGPSFRVARTSVLGMLGWGDSVGVVCFGRCGLGLRIKLRACGHAQRRCAFALTTEAEGLLHEGTIPESASRLTMAEITMSFGHGLRGLLPSIPGTVGLLSLWENGLKGIGGHGDNRHLTFLRRYPMRPGLGLT
eukprot:2117861-Amphidinium_carterae.1